MDNWDQQLIEQVKRGFDRYKTLRLNLSTAHIDHYFSLAGDFIYVEKVSSATVTATIKLNRMINDPINLFLHTQISTIFTGFYLSNVAQSDEWIELVIGCQFMIRREAVGYLRQAQSCVVITNAAANTNQAGPDQISDQVFLKADVKNTGIVWVEFGTAAIQDACAPFDPGEGGRFKVPNLNQININLEVANERLFVVPEL